MDKKEDKKETITRFDFIDADKRIIDQKVRKHIISPTEHQKILKALVDDKEASEDLLVYRDTEVS